MDASLYPQMAKMEEGHWWFVARRAIVRDMIASLHLPPNAAILEAGCGTGGNLAMLKTFGDVCGMELDEGAREIALSRAQAEVLPGCLPDDIPFGSKRFDLIALLDVLEHVKQDAESLKALKARLKPGGWLILTVPACPFLWSRHDETHHHFRRYTMDSLRKVADEAGFKDPFVSYFNTWLFPAVVGIRALKKIAGKQSDDMAMPGSFMNGVLRRIFASERCLLSRRMGFPIGVSLMMAAQA